MEAHRTGIRRTRVEAWQGALGHTHTRVRRHLDGLVHQKRVHLMPVKTSAVTRTSSATSRIMKNL